MAAGESISLSDIITESRKLILGLDWYGLGGIEFKRFAGQCYFIEMSVRLELFHQLAIKAGIDLPWLAYADIMLGENYAPSPQKPAYWLSGKAYLKQMAHPKTMLQAFREWLKIILSGRCQFSIASVHDLAPMFRHLQYILQKRS